MINKYWLEFSKIYARLMRLELKIKQNAYIAVKKYYKDGSLEAFDKFFNNKRRKRRYTNDRCNKLELIINNGNLGQLEKIKKLINTLYLSDILNFVLKTQQFKKSEIDSVFYCKIPDGYKILEDCIKNLTLLRNCIAHYNFGLYKKNKKAMLDSLFLFETHMGCNIANIKELPKIENPTIKNIVRVIYFLNPSLITDLESFKEVYCNKHRLLVSLYDDIAFYNGVPINELPSPWTILREVYRLKANVNFGVGIQDYLADLV